jgi:hypothetical protein
LNLKTYFFANLKPKFEQTVGIGDLGKAIEQILLEPEMLDSNPLAGGMHLGDDSRRLGSLPRMEKTESGRLFTQPLPRP